METQYRRIATFVLCVFALSWGCASTESTTGRAAANAGGASPSAIPLRDTHEDLNSVLWVQTSGEFWALTSTTYNNAQVLLEQAKSQKSWSAALEQKPGYENLPEAVIMDLDETVLDNSPAQGQSVLDRRLICRTRGEHGSTGWRLPRCPELSPSSAMRKNTE